MWAVCLAYEGTVCSSWCDAEQLCPFFTCSTSWLLFWHRLFFMAYHHVIRRFKGRHMGSLGSKFYSNTPFLLWSPTHGAVLGCPQALRGNWHTVLGFSRLTHPGIAPPPNRYLWLQIHSLRKIFHSLSVAAATNC